jgi:hypothetical protein
MFLTLLSKRADRADSACASRPRDPGPLPVGCPKRNGSTARGDSGGCVSGVVNPRHTAGSNLLPGMVMMVLSLVCTFQDTESRGDGPAPSAVASGWQARHTIIDTGPMSSELMSMVDEEANQSEAPTGGACAGSTSPSSAARTMPPVQHSARCPSGTLEVEGLYCTSLLHRCIKGGRTHTGERTSEPEPYYCDAFEVGRALCLGREEKKHFCIDEYEYPNQKGAIPMVMVSWHQAKRLCELLGKRLCGDDEWNLACEGPERLPYVYGWKRDRSICNIDKRWIKPNDGILGDKHGSLDRIQEEIDRLSRRVPSGSMPGCKSAYGVMDMGGNVDEWAVNVTWHGKPYQSILKGGHWMGGARNRCRPVTARHDETTTYYAQGFRCCANPQ